MRSHSDYRAAAELLSAGLGDAAIARRIGVPRSTIGRWRRDGGGLHQRTSVPVDGWVPPDESTYSYALGLYLGDGHIAQRSLRSATLFLSLDRRYPMIVQNASAALALLFPDAMVRQYHRDPQQLVLVRATHPVIPLAFPQHGPGRKHTRPIELAPWQRDLTARHPEALLRGLIHSDGCRSINRFKVALPSGRLAQYEYPRYFFSNLSADIRRIFTDHCELLGIRWTQSNARNISVSHRASVARLDAFVGPKA
jgi:hypothetical protein